MDTANLIEHQLGVADPDSIDPGASEESMLITTDSFEELSQEVSSDKNKTSSPKITSVTEIQEEIERITIVTTEEPAAENSETSDNEDLNELFSSANSNGNYLHDKEWLNVFILSLAGKPIYSLHGNEDKLATIFGVMQALVSFVQSNQDTIISIHAGNMKFVFLVKPTLILVAASKSNMSVQQIQLKLTDVYNQVLSILTLANITKIFEKQTNFDLRRLLGHDSPRLIDHLLVYNNSNRNLNKISNNPFIFLTHSVRILPISAAVRETIIGAIQNSCSKIKKLVFAILIANNKLIALVRMKKYFIHPADLRLIFNLIECSESFKTGENWAPICLPKFHSDGYLHAHLSYLSDDCQACLMLISLDPDAFFTLSEAKKKITEKLRRTNCLKAINDSMPKGINLRTIGIPEIRHFLYKSKSNAQLLCSELTIPYNTEHEYRRLVALYNDIHHRIHNTSRPLKLIFEMKEKEIMLAWVTTGYELYAVFEPTVDKNYVITLVNRLLGWIKKEEDSLFILTAPTF